jgi:hypothetical protein
MRAPCQIGNLLLAALATIAAGGCAGANDDAPEREERRVRPAAGTWSPPAALPQIAEPAQPGLVSPPGSAAGVVATAPRRFDCYRGSPAPARPLAATVGSDGTLSRPISLPPHTAALVAGGKGLVALSVTEQGKALYMCGAPATVAVAPAGRDDHRFGPPQTISRDTQVTEAAVAAAADGAVAVAWIDTPSVPDSREEEPIDRRLWLAVLAPDGGAPARRLVARLPAGSGDGSLSSVTLVAEPRGHGWLLVYARSTSSRHVVRAESVAPNGARRSAQELGPTSDATYLGAEVAATGRAVVAWGAQDAGEERDRPYAVRVARREPGSARFARTQVLDPGLPAQMSQRPASAPLVGLAADGTATVAWTRSRQTRTQPLRTSVAAPGRRFADGQTVARVAASGALGLAVHPDGATLLAWRGHRARDRDAGPVLVARRAPSSRSFQRPETVVGDGATTVSGVGFAPGDRRPTVVWGARPSEIPTQTTDVRVQVRR